MSDVLHGVIDQADLGRKNDYLYRISIKSLIRDNEGRVLVVKESGRNWWDLPGGGMDHGEDIKQAIARELHEEVGLVGEFTYRVIDVDEPVHLPNANVLQVRIIFEVFPDTLPTKPGEEGDEVAYLAPVSLQASSHPSESRISEYVKKADSYT